ncbi:MAG: transglutaminase domain-containing protein [Flavobacteriaceae bacterium]
MKLHLVSIFVIFSAYCQPSDFLVVNYSKADSVAAMYPGENIQNLPVLVHGLTAELSTDVEKFRAIYTWVATHIENDYRGFVRTVGKRTRYSKNRAKYLEWNDNYLPKMFKRLIRERKTACTGYAYLVREMAHLAGIKCKIINGYGRTAATNVHPKSLPNHSWNAVQLMGNWYLCDATWSAGRVVFDEDVPRFQFDYSDGYFLAPPKLFIKNHYPIDERWQLVGKKISFEEFLNGPLVYKGAFEKRIRPLVPKTMFLEIGTKRPLSIEFQANEDLANAHITLQLVKNDLSKELQPTITKTGNNYVVEHVFVKKGTYDVHLMIDGKAIATYVVKVVKSRA